MRRLFPERSFNDGGQSRMAANRPLGFEKSPYHAVTGGDATGCYAPEKCGEAVRQFVYVAPDYFVIYDRVTSVKPDQKKSFLLHTQNEPEELSPGLWRSEAGEGALFIRPLLPEKAAAEVIGRPREGVLDERTQLGDSEPRKGFCKTGTGPDATGWSFRRPDRRGRPVS